MRLEFTEAEQAFREQVRAFLREKLPAHIREKVLGGFELNREDHVLWQRTLLLFIQVRFETSIQLTAKEVEDYFTKPVKPEAEKAHPGQAVLLDDYREQIERKLTGERADQQMDIWLREVRRRTNVMVHDEVLR